MISYRRACLSVACFVSAPWFPCHGLKLRPRRRKRPPRRKRPLPRSHSPLPRSKRNQKILLNRCRKRRLKKTGEARPAAAPRNSQARRAAQDTTGGKVIEAIIFTGARRVPQDTLRAMISTKKGDIYNEDALRRDFMSLWNTGRFDDIRLETEPGTTGGSSCVSWSPSAASSAPSTTRASNPSPSRKSWTGSRSAKSACRWNRSTIPNKVQRAAVVLKEFLAERGRQYATVEPEIEQIPPSSLEGRLST